MTPYSVVEYLENGKSPYAEWFRSLDSDAAAKVDRYIRRMENGNFNAAKMLRQGVFELRIDSGPGYRIYFGRVGLVLVILLAGGTKRTQRQDIEKAIARWTAYKKQR